MSLFILRCIDCTQEFPADTPRWRCECGAPLDVDVKGIFPREGLSRRRAGLWRYREALPIEDDRSIVSLDEGMTPLVALPFAGREVLCKLDFLFPTGSFKDRGATLLISKVREWGVREVLGDSSGNAAAAIAAYTGRAGIACDMYVPEDTSPAKCAQIAAYGARLVKIPGSRQATTDAAMRAAESRFYASHFWNCWFNHGTKTWAFEVWEQLGGRAPDTVVVPAGHGSMLIGAHKGFGELFAAGYIDRMPRIYAAQAARCAPLREIWRGDLKAIPAIEARPTLAEGISITRPVRWRQMAAAVRETGGEVLVVEDEALPPVLRHFARRGVLMEPTSAVPFAGLEILVKEKKIGAGETVAIPVTGHGLKAADKLEKLVVKEG